MDNLIIEDRSGRLNDEFRQIICVSVSLFVTILQLIK